MESRASNYLSNTTTVTEFSGRCDVHVSHASRILRGLKYPSAKLKAAALAAFNVPLEWWNEQLDKNQLSTRMSDRVAEVVTTTELDSSPLDSIDPDDLAALDAALDDDEKNPKFKPREICKRAGHIILKKLKDSTVSVADVSSLVSSFQKLMSIDERVIIVEKERLAIFMKSDLWEDIKATILQSIEGHPEIAERLQAELSKYEI